MPIRIILEMESLPLISSIRRAARPDMIFFVSKVVPDKIKNAISLERQARMFETEELPMALSTIEYLYQNTTSSLTGLYEIWLSLEYDFKTFMILLAYHLNP